MPGTEDSDGDAAAWLASWMKDEAPGLYDREAEAEFYLERRFRTRYRISIKELPDGNYYWNLYVLSTGERVNGGISETYEGAYHAGRSATGWPRTSPWDPGAEPLYEGF